MYLSSVRVIAYFDLVGTGNAQAKSSLFCIKINPHSLSITNQPYRGTLLKLVLNTALAGVLCAVLTACGGGGDDTGSGGGSVLPPPADKYVGIWKTPCAPGLGGFYRSALTITKRADSSYNGQFSIEKYVASDCSGTSTPVPGDSASEDFKVVGTKVASGKTVDKITDLTGGNKDIAFADTTLQFGDDRTLDIDGYPVALDSSIVLTKQ
jgi:hypothetical protein